MGSISRGLAPQERRFQERPMTTAVTDADFKQKVLEAEGPVVVDFWAEWCGPCRQIAPALEQISKEMAGKVTITKLNVDENQETPSNYGIRGIPTLIMFKDGKVVSQKVGAVPKKALEDWIKQAIATS
jgi:thioredoxin 1